MNVRKSRLPAIFPLSLAHMSCDLTQGALPVLLPFFMAQYSINYAAAAMIVFAANMVATVAQPLLGYMSDRRSKPWLIPLGVILSGVGFALAGVMPSYTLVVVAVGLSGLGVATFHPEGARQAHRMAGEKKATAMSLFTFGGQVGFAVGPVVATAILLRAGLKGTLYFALLAFVVAGYLSARFKAAPTTSGHGSPGKSAPSESGGRDAWGPFCCVAAAVVCRSTIFYGLNTFLPLFWVNVLNQSKTAGGTALSVLVAGSIAGNLLGGRIADRFGYRPAALVEFTLLACVLPLLPLTASSGMAVLLLIPIGLLLSAPTSSTVVLGQGYLPNHIGFSSGVTMGLAFSFGGLLTPLFGWIADQYGLRVAISLVSVIPVLCALLILILPSAKRTAEADVALS